MSRSEFDYLRHILDEIKFLGNNIASVTAAEFFQSETLRRASARTAGWHMRALARTLALSTICTRSFSISVKLFRTDMEAERDAEEATHWYTVIQ